MRSSNFVALAAAFALTSASVSTAAAHHGRSYTQDGLFEIKGVITSIYLGNPHSTLDVDVEGETWRVELSPLAQTRREGFTEASAKAGDEVTAVGNRSRDESEKRMRAVSITVNGKTYDATFFGRAPTPD